MGVDALEAFNFFCADEVGHHPGAKRRQAVYPVLNGLADLESLRGQNKQYTLATRPGLYEFPLWENAEQLPAYIEAQGYHAFRISMCREPRGELVIQLVLDRAATLPLLGVSFNGSWPVFANEISRELLFPAAGSTHHISSHVGLNFVLDAGLIREGWNEILVINDTGERVWGGDGVVVPAEVVVLHSVELAYRAEN
jgi:hypothetical protein